MPHQLCARFNCARCKREWFVDYIEGKPVPKQPFIKLEFFTHHGLDVPEKVELDPLCQTCAQTILTHVRNIDRKMEHVSPIRSGSRAKKKEPKALPPK